MSVYTEIFKLVVFTLNTILILIYVDGSTYDIDCFN